MQNQIKSSATHISDIIGEWGLWQFQMVCFTFVWNIIGAYNNLGYSFHAFSNDYWCKDVPEDYPNKTIEMKCFMFSNANQTCNEWQYNTTVFNRSIVTEFNLVCNRADYASLTQASYMASYVISGLVLSYLQDRYGRRPLVWVAIIVETLGTLGCAVATNMTQYIIARFFVGMGGSGRVAMEVIVIEVAGPKHRSDISILADSGWIFGYCLVPGIAYWLRDYKLMLYVSLVSLILIMVWLYFLDESPRWLLTTARTERAEKTFNKILRINGRSNDNLKQQLNELTTYLQRMKTENEKKQKVTAIDLFRTKNLRKYTLVFWYLGIICALVYYGFSLNMSDYGGNIYITFLLSGLVELPSAVVSAIGLRYIGRNILFAIFTLTISIACFCIIFSESLIWKVVLALIGKFGVTSSWTVMGIHRSEVLPTILRQTGSGTTSLVSRIGAISAPFMKNLAAKTDLSVVMAIYIFGALSAGALGFILPETKSRHIPDTIEETENMKSRNRSKNNKV